MARSGALVGAVVVVAAASAGTIVVRGRKAPEGPHAPEVPATSYPIARLSGVACVATLRACLERLPGVARAEVVDGRATLTLAPGATPPPVREVLAAVRSTGHDVKGSEETSPALPPLSADEAKALDRLEGEWLHVRLRLPPCQPCAQALPDRVKECPGVLEVVSVHFANDLAVRRDPARCSASALASFLRALTLAPVEVRATRRISLNIEGMFCQRCVASIQASLMRTKGVLRSHVQEGAASVVVEPELDAHDLVEAVENARAPTCMKVPAHVFKAQVVRPE